MYRLSPSKLSSHHQLQMCRCNLRAKKNNIFLPFSRLRHKPPRLQLWRCGSVSAGLLSLPLEFGNPMCGGPFGPDHTVRTAVVRLSNPVHLLSVLEWGWPNPLHWHQAEGDSGIQMWRWEETVARTVCVTNLNIQLNNHNVQVPWLCFWLCSCGMSNTRRKSGLYRRTCLWSELFPGNKTYWAGRTCHCVWEPWQAVCFNHSTDKTTKRTLV